MLSYNRPISAIGENLYLSVVVPCFNEQEVLPELHRRVSAACSGIGREYEIILVNDGSTDSTWNIMTALAAGDGHIVGVNLSRNHGHQLALTAGLSFARGERVLILDSDLQDPPELLPQMLAVMDGGADVVYGQRRHRAGETSFKRWSASFFYRLMDRLTEVPIPRDTGDFRLVSRRALDVLCAMPERHRFIRGMVSWIGFRQEPIAYDRAPRVAGRTKYPLTKMIRFAFDAITAFSVKPLALASITGLLAAGLGMLLLVYTLISWIFFKAVQGWSSLLAAVSILASVQLFVLGIIGEYLGRLYEQSKGRPLFIVERVVRSTDTAGTSAGDTSPAGTNPVPPP